MFGRKRKQSLGRTAASGVVFDPEIRRAALQAAPPVARLGYTVGKRAVAQQARQQLDEAGEAFSHLTDEAGQTFSHLASLLSTTGPQLAEQLGLIEPPRRRRRLGPVVGGAALALVAVVVATDPGRRQRIQRLIVH